MHRSSPARCTSRCIGRWVRSLAPAWLLVLGATLPLSSQEIHAVAGVRIQPTNAGGVGDVGSVSSVVQLSNGSIVIADNSNRQLHFYTSGGRFVRSVGRDGAGPAEFKALRWIGECGRDSIYAFDYMQSRITVFSADGQLARTFSPPNVQTVMMRCSVNGTMAYVTAGDFVGTTSRGVVQTYSSHGKLLYRTVDMMLDEGRPLGKSIKLSMDENNVIFGIGDSAFVVLQSSDGKARKKLPAGIVGRTPTELNRTIATEYWANYLRAGPGDMERTLKFLSTLPPVKVLPAYTDMFMDGVTKAAWVQTSSLGDPNTVLQRVEPDGTSKGNVLLPPNLLVQQVRGDVLVAKMMNAVTGGESVVTYRLVTPSR